MPEALVVWKERVGNRGGHLRASRTRSNYPQGVNRISIGETYAGKFLRVYHDIPMDDIVINDVRVNLKLMSGGGNKGTHRSEGLLTNSQVKAMGARLP